MTDLGNLQGTRQDVCGPMVVYTASDATVAKSIWVAPIDCVLEGVYLVAYAAITGADTNTTHVNVLDAGAAGTGTTEIGALDLVNGTDVVAAVPTSLIVTATAMTAGDVLKVQYEEIGNGGAVTVDAGHLFLIRYRAA